jgi:hypothetical protein
MIKNTQKLKKTKEEKKIMCYICGKKTDGNIGKYNDRR